MWRWAIVLVAICFIFIPSSASAEELVFATSVWPPYMISENGKVSGIDTEIVLEICRRLNLQAEIQPLPWTRALKYVEDGRADAGFSARRTPEREKLFYYPPEILHLEKTAIFALKSSHIKVDKLEYLTGKPIAMVRGYSYGPDFDKDKGMIKIECDNDEQMLNMLLRKRIKLIVGANEGSIKYLSKKAGVELEMIYIFDGIPSYIIFSKKLGEKGRMLADKFGETLRQLKQEGFVEEVRRKYF